MIYFNVARSLKNQKNKTLFGNIIYAPKIVAIFVSLLIFLPLMGALMGNFMNHIVARIAAM